MIKNPKTEKVAGSSSYGLGDLFTDIFDSVEDFFSSPVRSVKPPLLGVIAAGSTVVMCCCIYLVYRKYRQNQNAQVPSEQIETTELQALTKGIEGEENLSGTRN